MNRASVDSFYLYDGLGTTRQLTDSVESVKVSYVYDSFGNLIASTGTSNNTYGFTGEQQFKETDDLVFLRARYYDPKVGRLISRDPMGYIDSVNLYTYSLNNPVNYTDPTGSAIVGTAITVYLTGKSVHHGIMMCISGYYCGKCIERAHEIKDSVADNSPSIEFFHNWMQKNNPYQDCVPLCSKALAEGIQTFFWYMGKVYTLRVVFNSAPI
jgi:RHS repeat-associated protein